MGGDDRLVLRAQIYAENSRRAGASEVHFSSNALATLRSIRAKNAPTVLGPSQTFFGFAFRVDDAVPAGEIRFMDADGYVIAAMNIND